MENWSSETQIAHGEESVFECECVYVCLDSKLMLDTQPQADIHNEVS